MVRQSYCIFLPAACEWLLQLFFGTSNILVIYSDIIANYSFLRGTSFT